MIHERDLSHMLDEWLRKLEEANSLHNGEAICEASRMVISICSMLWAYHPDGFTKEVQDRARMLLQEGVSFISSDIEESRGQDGYYALYKRNVAARLQTLEELEKEPCIK